MRPELLAPEQYVELKKEADAFCTELEKSQEEIRQHYIWIINTFESDKDIYKMVKCECKLLNKGILKRGEINALIKEVYRYILSLKYC